MQTGSLFPMLGNRMNPKEWIEADRRLLLDGAIRRKNDILARAGCLIDPQVDLAIRSRFTCSYG